MSDSENSIPDFEKGPPMRKAEGASTSRVLKEHNVEYEIKKSTTGGTSDKKNRDQYNLQFLHHVHERAGPSGLLSKRSTDSEPERPTRMDVRSDECTAVLTEKKWRKLLEKTCQTKPTILNISPKENPCKHKPIPQSKTPKKFSDIKPFVPSQKQNVIETVQFQHESSLIPVKPDVPQSTTFSIQKEIQPKVETTEDFSNIPKEELQEQQIEINKPEETLIQCRAAATECKKAVHETVHPAIVLKEQHRQFTILSTAIELFAQYQLQPSSEERLRILSQIHDEKAPRLPGTDAHDSFIIKIRAALLHTKALYAECVRNMKANRALNKLKIKIIQGDHPQPSNLRGNLKKHQLRGMNWLVNFYRCGLTGILADEATLGKTVQSIAFLCHIAEKYSICGPFLIVSSVFNYGHWLNKLAKFAPHFKVFQYRGNANQKTILERLRKQKSLRKKRPRFDILITSYEIAICDPESLYGIEWQYMILNVDEVNNRESSMTWKPLFGVNCDSKLILIDAPIQNDINELWPLLYFIVPTLFDSNVEFHKWSERKTDTNESHLSRLRVILEPYILRRTKQDVENELSEKMEVTVYCPLTRRQKSLYKALKQNIQIEDDNSRNLMNLVVDFCKICNHPELFEGRDIKSVINLNPILYDVPNLVYNYQAMQIKHHLIRRYFSFARNYISEAIKTDPDTMFKFIHFTKLSYQDLELILTGNMMRGLKTCDNESESYKLYCRSEWSNNITKEDVRCMSYQFKMSLAHVRASEVLQEMTCVSRNTPGNVVYTYTKHSRGYTPKTLEDKNIRCKETTVEVYDLVKTTLPSFLFTVIPKVQTIAPNLISRLASWDITRVIDDFSCHGGSSQNEFGISSLHCVNHLIFPDKETLVTDSGKLFVLDGMLNRLKAEERRVVIFAQMNDTTDLLEQFMRHRCHRYMRLDRSLERGDVVADLQVRTNLLFLSSTRAGSLGINLITADTVIFYDSNWNPAVDQQAMSDTLRFVPTEQITVYRLICRDSIEERILQRAGNRSEASKLVAEGSQFKMGALQPEEVVSFLLDDEGTKQTYRIRNEERKELGDTRVVQQSKEHVSTLNTVHMSSVQVERQKIDPTGVEHFRITGSSSLNSPCGESSKRFTGRVYKVHTFDRKPSTLRLQRRGLSKHTHPEGSGAPNSRESNPDLIASATIPTKRDPDAASTSFASPIAGTSTHISDAEIIDQPGTSFGTFEGPSTSSATLPWDDGNSSEKIDKRYTLFYYESDESDS